MRLVLCFISFSTTSVCYSFSFHFVRKYWNRCSEFEVAWRVFGGLARSELIRLMANGGSKVSGDRWSCDMHRGRWKSSCFAENIPADLGRFDRLVADNEVEGF